MEVLNTIKYSHTEQRRRRESVFCLLKLHDILMRGVIFKRLCRLCSRACLPTCPWARACVCLLPAFKGCASLLWGSWGPACSSVQHRDSDTSCIHRHRPLPAFDVRSAAQPLTTETPRSYQICPARRKRKKKKKTNQEQTLLTPINMFLLSNGKEEVVWYPWTKNKLFGSGHSGVSDWLTAWAKFPGSVFVSNCFSNSPRHERVLPEAEKW